jgi:hypothetical protein
MKSCLFVSLLVFISSCTSSTATKESNSSDSAITSIDSIIPVQEVIADARQEETVSSRHTGTGLDSAWLKDFALRPLGSDPYGNLSGTLRVEGASFSGDSINGNSEIIFGNSRINIITAEAYGSLVCSFDIYSPKIFMEKGISIGMSREDFLSVSGIPASLLNADSDDKESFEFNISYDANTSTRTIFWVDKKALIRVEYAYTPCTIYE